ncbi:MAG: helix-turn-helix domain-containing protein [Candidatus Buchananbacteria bacterium]
MVSFNFKEINNPPSLGQQLQEIREKLKISLDQAAKSTGIAAKYLTALESGQYHQLPGEVYAKSFLKVYTKFLGLDFEDFVSLYQSEQTVYAKTKNSGLSDFKKPVRKISRIHLIVTPRIVRSAIIALLALACLFYLGVKVKMIMTPPDLKVQNPVNNLTTDQNFIEVSGSVEKETKLEVNGQQILVDKDGHFSEMIDLQSGVNTIEVSAESRHGKQTKVYRQVMVNQNNN